MTLCGTVPPFFFLIRKKVPLVQSPLRVLWVLLFFLCSAAVAELATIDDELLLVAARSSFLHELLHKPISNCETIDSYTKKTQMSGPAETKGLVTGIAANCKEGAAIVLNMDSQTVTATKNRHDMRKSQVHFDWTITTDARTQKLLMFREDGIIQSPPTTSAQSGIVVHEMGVTAQGPLGGIGRRAVVGTMAPGKMQKDLPGFAKEASETVAGKLNPGFDKDTKAFVDPLNEKYVTNFYEPFVKRGLLGGRISFGSDQNWIGMTGTRGDGPKPFNVANLKGFTDPLIPLFVRLHKDFAERIAEKRIGGTLLSEVEAAEIVGEPESTEETIDNILGNEREELLLTYHKEKPVLFELEKDTIKITFRFSELTTLGNTVKDIQFSRSIVLTKGNGGQIWVTRPKPTDIKYIDGKEVEEALAKHITARVSRHLSIMPFDLTKMEIFKGVKPLRVKQFDANDNRLTVGLVPVEGK